MAKKDFSDRSASVKTIDEYISGFPEDVQEILQNIRKTIRKAVPEAEETISYKMPAFNLNGTYLVYFAAWKTHIGLYPRTSGMEAEFKDELTGLTHSKGTIKFSYDKPIPYNLISRIVVYRVNEMSEKPVK